MSGIAEHSLVLVYCSLKSQHQRLLFLRQELNSLGGSALAALTDQLGLIVTAHRQMEQQKSAMNAFADKHDQERRSA